MPVVNSNKEPFRYYIGSGATRHFRFLHDAIPKYFDPDAKAARYNRLLGAWLDDFPEAQEKVAMYRGEILGCDCGHLEHCHGHAILEFAEIYWNKLYNIEVDEVVRTSNIVPIAQSYVLMDKQGVFTHTSKLPQGLGTYASVLDVLRMLEWVDGMWIPMKREGNDG